MSPLRPAPAPARRIVLVNSHFAAHQEKVDERNADYAKIARTMRFRNTRVAASAATPTAAPSAAEGEVAGRGQE